MANLRLEEHPAASGEVGQAILALADAGRAIAALLAHGTPLPDDSMDAAVLAALRAAPVSWVACGDAETPLLLDPDAVLAVAIEPLDGLADNAGNTPAGTIFSVMPASAAGEASFLCPGHRQLAAGFLIYGAHTALVLTVGEGTHLFVLDRETGGYVEASEPVRVPLEAREYAIDGAGERHWDAVVRRFAAECRQGVDGPLGRDLNTRWLGSLVAGAYRILRHGGICLYPADSRDGRGDGSLRLVHEARPIAWLVEEAGGAATDGRRRILDLTPRSLQQRVPLAFGAVADVNRLGGYYATPEPARHEPLFGTRTLFRGQGGIGARACR